MAAESKFQSIVRDYLKEMGCYVLVVQPQAGIPSACPDIIALAPNGAYIALELKGSNPYKKNGEAKAGAFRPLQERTIARLAEDGFARIVWPEIWTKTKIEIEQLLF